MDINIRIVWTFRIVKWIVTDSSASWGFTIRICFLLLLEISFVLSCFSPADFDIFVIAEHKKSWSPCKYKIIYHNINVLSYIYDKLLCHNLPTVLHSSQKQKKRIQKRGFSWKIFMAGEWEDVYLRHFTVINFLAYL